MKTAKEILRKHYPKHLTIVEEENTLKAMEEYADQFKPKEPEVKNVKSDEYGEIVISDNSMHTCRHCRYEGVDIQEPCISHCRRNLCPAEYYKKITK
ncbi:MAG: hypothetical protein WC389_16995 [Lutibacter sp.]|jgi:hypothetical protein